MLRSTGQLSRNVHPYREEPAGPQIPTPEAQLVGTTTVQLAVLPHGGDWRDGGLLDAAERYRHPLHAALGAGPLDSAPASGEGITVRGALLTILRRRDEAVEIRLVAQSPDDSTAVVRGAFDSAQRVDLLGRGGASVPVEDGTFRLPLRPWEIATVRVS